MSARSNTCRWAVISLLLVITCNRAFAGKTLYVDDDGPADFNNIQAAIDDANDGDSIIISTGTYTGDGNRDIDFRGKAITVRSIDPFDVAVVEATVIDCQGSKTTPHRGFRFHSGEGPDSIICGLTIRNGYGPDEDVYISDQLSAGGAIFCVSSNPIFIRCKIEANHAGFKGGGICCKDSSPMIANCTFGGNSAHHGGGMSNQKSNPTLINCTFSRNSSEESGGAICNIQSSPTVINCIFTENSAGSNGGGMYNKDYSSPTIANCVFGWNSTNSNGGGMFNYDYGTPIVTGCTFNGNSASDRGGGIFSNTDTTVANCILWHNRDSGGSHESAQVHKLGGWLDINYSCVQGLTNSLGGMGNIDADPLLESDGYHLRAASGCVDAGEPLGYYGGEADIDRQPRVMGDRVDIGADEFGTESLRSISVYPTQIKFTAPVADPNLHSETLFIHRLASDPFDWRIVEDCFWLDVSETGGRLTGEVDQVTVSINARSLSLGRYTCDLSISDSYPTHSPVVVPVTLTIHLEGLLRVPVDFGTIQVAIDAAGDGDTIIVADGTYAGRGNRAIDFHGKRITVRSESGPENCIIDCQGVDRGFYFHSNEDSNSVLKGFTITNGYVDNSGGGIYCRDSSPMVTDCVLISNSAGHGGGLMNVNSSPTLSRCTFQQNSSRELGGAIENYHSNAKILLCAFNQNSAGQVGGAIFNYHSDTTFERCIFSENSGNHGGAIYSHRSNPIFMDCIFVRNRARFTDASLSGNGGAMFNSGGAPVLTNCSFIFNEAEEKGGGMYNIASNITLRNCTFMANSATKGNAVVCDLWQQEGPSIVQIINCILWDGSNEIWNGDGSAIAIRYSDVQGGETIVYDPYDGLVWGDGNIDAEPIFADLNNGDYHLKSQAGRWDANERRWTKDDVTSPCIDAGDMSSTIGFEPFPNGGVINMGAYGGTEEASKSYFGEPLCDTIIAGDINGDCKVDFKDFAIMASHWLEESKLEN